MRPYLTAKFLRVGNHLINLELIQQLELRKDDSAVITVPGPRKSFQVIEVPAPAGRQLWEFFSENLVVIDFEPKEEEHARTKRKTGGKAKEPKAPSAKKPESKTSGGKKSQPKKKVSSKKPQAVAEQSAPES